MPQMQARSQYQAFAVALARQALTPPSMPLPDEQEVQALLEERDAAVVAKEAEVQGLQSHVARLLGVSQANAGALHRAQHNLGPVEERLAALEVMLCVAVAWLPVNRTRLQQYVVPRRAWHETQLRQMLCRAMPAVPWLTVAASHCLAGCQRATGGCAGGNHTQRCSGRLAGAALRCRQRRRCRGQADGAAGGGAGAAAGGRGAGGAAGEAAEGGH